MQTTSIGIQNLCAPCSCSCRYCLLSSNRKADHIDYYRGKKIAERFAAWAKEHPSPTFVGYFVAYCAEYPELPDTIAFNQVK